MPFTSLVRLGWQFVLLLFENSIWNPLSVPWLVHVFQPFSIDECCFQACDLLRVTRENLIVPHYVDQLFICFFPPLIGNMENICTIISFFLLSSWWMVINSNLYSMPCTSYAAHDYFDLFFLMVHAYVSWFFCFFVTVLGMLLQFFSWKGVLLPLCSVWGKSSAFV